ncbi:MAG: sensor histidine kinase [Verrucomicrobia bacterium]|nr:sensor histidine kinase [Verrucomicrobiota bacterium]
MRNALRLIVLVLALGVVGSTAALLQMWVHHRALERQHQAATTDAGRTDALRPYRADQQKAFALLLGVSLAALLVTTLIPDQRGADTTPLKQVRKEIQNAENLAITTVTQNAALVRERDVRQRTEESLQVQQRLVSRTLDEKIRLGRDLHDGTIQSLYAAGLMLESTRELLRRDPDEATRRIETALKTINDTIREVRAHITGLTPDNVRKDSLIAVLSAVAEELRAGREVAFDYTIDDSAAAALSGEQLAHLVPFVREAISNALRHGQARHIILRLHEGDNAVCLLVQDDGRGFDSSAVSGSGHGLANLRARAESTGGSLNLTSTPGAGTRLVITLPVSVAG